MLSAAKDFRIVQKEVAELIKGRILVGHALRNDFKVTVHLLRLCVWSTFYNFLRIFSCTGLVIKPSKARYS